MTTSNPPPLTTVAPSLAWCGRCFTYPQGFISFVPQVVATAAILMNWLAFSGFTLFGWMDHAQEFMCNRVKISGQSSSYECYPLVLSSTEYWDTDKRWAWAIVLATLLAIIAISFGGVATLMLLSATCFELQPRRLYRMSIFYFIASGCSLFTMIAGATNLCNISSFSGNCERDGARLAKGGTLMLIASFFYLAAGLLLLFSYRKEIMASNRDVAVGDNGKEEPTHNDAEDEEIAPFIVSPPPPQAFNPSHGDPTSGTTSSPKQHPSSGRKKKGGSKKHIHSKDAPTSSTMMSPRTDDTPPEPVAAPPHRHNDDANWNDSDSDDDDKVLANV